MNYQTELEILIKKLSNDYKPRNPRKAKEKNEFQNALEFARVLLDARKDIIVFFEKGTFLYKDVFKTKEEKLQEKSEDESEEKKLEK